MAGVGLNLRRLTDWRRFRALARLLSRLLTRWWSAAEVALARRFGVATQEERRFYLLIPVVGVLAGVLGVTVHRLIDGLRHLLWGGGDLLSAAQSAPAWRVVAVPTAGGVLVGLLIWMSRERVAGHGMGALIEAVALHQGKVPARPLVMSALAAVATVGSGGSLGKEGPMIRLGAMISSLLGQRLGVTPHRLKILVGCGAAAGLAAAYNVPFGGALFAMEVILGNFALEIFGPIVVAAVLSTLIARSFEGNVPVYAMPAYTLVSGREIVAYLGLGLVCALASVVFVFGVRAGLRLFSRGRWLPAPLRPVLGMGLLGVCALWVPHVLGSGLDTISLALSERLPLTLLLLLPFAKILATSLTAGSGGAGGMFTPSLVVGALVGGAYGHWVHDLWPGLTSSYGAYAAVGMAAIAAGTTHAPITAILILFELTGNYGLILPLMVAAITASALARWIYPYSSYTESLERRGVDLSFRMEEAALAGIRVQDLVRKEVELLRPDDPYPVVVDAFFRSHRQRLFVVDDAGKLVGAVSLHDIKQVLEAPAMLVAVVAYDLATPVPVTLSPDDRLHRVAELFAQSAFERMPVVEGGSGRLIGVLAKGDLLAIYAQEVVGRPVRLATFVQRKGDEPSRDYVQLPPDYSLKLVPVPPRLVGSTLADAALTTTMGLRVIEVKRRSGGDTSRLIADAETRLQAGDEMIVIGPEEEVERLRSESPG